MDFRLSEEQEQILADSFTGIWAVWKRKGRKKIKSRPMGRIVAKLILYPLCLIVGKVAEQYLTPAIPWIDVTAGILAVIEVKSIFENVSLILGYDIWDKIKDALSRKAKVVDKKSKEDE